MFDFIFQKLSPEEFVRFFEKEADQVKAFILSFSTAEYIRAVIDLYGNEGFTVFI
jgi:hypothetical protein